MESVAANGVAAYLRASGDSAHDNSRNSRAAANSGVASEGPIVDVQGPVSRSRRLPPLRPSQRAGRAERPCWSRPGSCSAAWQGWSASGCSAITSASRPPPTRTGPRFGCPTSCRTSWEREFSPHPSSPSMPACGREARRQRPARWRGGGGVVHAAHRRRLADRRCRHALDDRRHRARFPRRDARARDRADADLSPPLCWCSRRFASACSTATAASFSAMRRRSSGARDHRRANPGRAHGSSARPEPVSPSARP